ncbi:aminoacyl-tRNA hydrolase [uncultured Selenomonas sp.]|uniref:aminoacyl-tRNA hydrolase n=1 Tax=uncultured Selenomonas sp. TaxID=159275 RepID=UPI0028DC086E|nr:aminoacyl-tRNA hydrolase [uncultured Selenomonas sp.]
MKIIAGLGNPGAEYAHTKHNVGFMLVDALAEELGIDAWREKFNALVAEGRIGAEKVLLVKPLTYMNESGRALAPLLDWYKLAPEELIVVHDDMDIAVGTIRLRRKGSAGGHNGIKSLLAHIGSQEFSRVRIGIGRPLPGWTVVRHVLAPFSAEDGPKVHEAIAYLLPAVECIVTDGIDMAMNRYNPRNKKAAKQEAQERKSAEKSSAVPQVERQEGEA